ncbi:hypothetical protein ACQP06_08065 [Nocardia sp. CA-136227]|uniref:hypothetical protein n=1 Tax=Nocardia sp. CA-136227 TaxID=3239979 RepID=UPI003D9932F1
MTTYSHTVALTADFGFNERIPEGRRQEIRNSISGLITQQIDANTRRREAAAEERALADALQEPYLDQLRNSTRGADALRLAAERGRTRTLDVRELTPAAAENPSRNVPAGAFDYQFAPTRDFEGPPTRVFAIPYDFHWFWHDLNGSPPFNQIITDDSGRVALDARVGNASGATGTLVNAHAGYGVSLRSDRRVNCMARSFRSTQDFGIASAGLSADATVEAGCEMTVMQAGHLVTMATDKRFRGRVSGTLNTPTQNYEYDTGGFGPGAVIEVLWTMEANTDYELNVGAWVYAESHHGIGGASAQSQIDAKVIFMSLWQQ